MANPWRPPARVSGGNICTDFAQGFTPSFPSFYQCLPRFHHVSILPSAQVVMKDNASWGPDPVSRMLHMSNSSRSLSHSASRSGTPFQQR